MKIVISKWHPITKWLYFISVMTMTMFIIHPIFLAISFVAALTQYMTLVGIHKARKGIGLKCLTILIIMLINPLFNHAGITILTYMGDNPLTLESIIYGLSMGLMFSSALMWFGIYHEVMTSDQIIDVLGRIAPKLALLLAMTLKLVPQYKKQFEVVTEAQRGMGLSPNTGYLWERAQKGLRILSIVVSWALESSIETVDTMRARGYGLKGRTHYSRYKIKRRHLLGMIGVSLLLILILFGLLKGAAQVKYFPSFSVGVINDESLLAYLVYSIFCLLPLLDLGKEQLKWYYLKSKI